MEKSRRIPLAAYVLIVGWLLLVPRYGNAAVITGMYYAVGDELRVVDFDGTSFTSAATILEPLVPDWTAMSYDATAGRIYYAVGDELRVVDFDGTSFTSAATILEPLVPDWTAMSLVFAPTPVPESGTLALLCAGLAALAFGRRCRTPVPSGTGSVRTS